ncbi:hypothetical protein ACFL1S_02335 [Pseudomonadota bacterium]
MGAIDTWPIRSPVETYILPGETLPSLFGELWRDVYELPENEALRRRFTDPKFVLPGWPIYFPSDLTIDRPISRHLHPPDIESPGTIYFWGNAPMGDLIAQSGLLQQIKLQSPARLVLVAKYAWIIESADEQHSIEDVEGAVDFIKGRYVPGDLVFVPENLGQHFQDPYFNAVFPRSDTHRYLLQRSLPLNMLWYHAGMYGFKVPQKPRVTKPARNVLKKNTIHVHTGSWDCMRRLKVADVVGMQRQIQRMGYRVEVSSDDIILNTLNRIGVHVCAETRRSVDNVKRLRDAGANVVDCSVCDLLERVAQCRLFISPDTGPLWYRYALDAPTIAIQAHRSKQWIWPPQASLSCYDKPLTFESDGLGGFDIDWLVAMVGERLERN